MIDCSEVIPKAIPFTGGPATLPPGQTMNDIEQAVSMILEQWETSVDSFSSVCYRCIPISRYPAR